VTATQPPTATPSGSLTITHSLRLGLRFVSAASSVSRTLPHNSQSHSHPHSPTPTPTPTLTSNSHPTLPYHPLTPTHTHTHVRAAFPPTHTHTHTQSRHSRCLSNQKQTPQQRITPAFCLHVCWSSQPTVCCCMTLLLDDHDACVAQCSVCECGGAACLISVHVGTWTPGQETRGSVTINCKCSAISKQLHPRVVRTRG